MFSVEADNFLDWRAKSRTLLVKRIPPEEVQWLDGNQAGLFKTADLMGQWASNPISTQQIKVPKTFIQKVQQASCFIDQSNPAKKWAVFYSLLWRLNMESRSVLAIKSDPQVVNLNQMARAVSRDCHKMKAFVRFQKASDIDAVNKQEYFTSWFESDHKIIERVAPFFAKRFAGMTFSILTPHGCAHWDRKELKISPGVQRPDLNQDEYEIFWRAYYRNIFNPARLKEQAMRSEMPKKYWQYLPESRCIRPLANASSVMVEKMLEAKPTRSNRYRNKSKRLRESQDTLRQTVSAPDS